MTRLFKFFIGLFICLQLLDCGKFSPKKREEMDPPSDSNLKVPTDWDGTLDFEGGDWKISE